MTAVEFLNQYILYIFIACIAGYVVHSLIEGKRTKLDTSLVDSLNNIAQELDAGNSIESAITTISKDKSNPSSKYLAKIIEETKKGHSFEESLEIVSKKTHSKTFAYICDIILLAQKSKGNIADSLKKLSQNLWEIDHLQASVNSKAAGPASTLKILGIVIIPLLYYMMAAVLSSETMLIEITTSFKVYFFAVALAMTFSDYFLFGDIEEGLYILPFSISYLILVFLKIGPYITIYFGG